MQCSVIVDQLPIDVLPGDVLQEIFACCVGEAQPKEIEAAWQSESLGVKVVCEDV